MSEKAKTAFWFFATACLTLTVVSCQYNVSNMRSDMARSENGCRP